MRQWKIAKSNPCPLYPRAKQHLESQLMSSSTSTRPQQQVKKMKGKKRKEKKEKETAPISNPSRVVC